ncbi:unnamed protein product, partial [Vitis vinifera]
MSDPLGASLQKGIATCSDEVSLLPYTGNALSSAQQIGNLDDQGNALERTEELEFFIEETVIDRDGDEVIDGRQYSAGPSKRAHD